MALVRLHLPKFSFSIERTAEKPFLKVFFATAAFKRYLKMPALSLLLFILTTGLANAATITTTGSGNWSSTVPNAPWPGGSIPATTDNVIIGDGFTLTVDGNRTCNALTIGNGSTISVNATFTLTVTTSTTFPNSATVNTTGTMTGSGTITTATMGIGGSIAPTAAATTTATSTITTLNVTGNLTITSLRPGAIANNPIFQLQSGTVTVNGTLTCVTAANAASTTLVDMTSGTQSGTLVLANTTAVSTSGPGGVSTFTLNGTSATVKYSGAIQTALPTTYTNLTVLGTGNKTFATTPTVNGTLSMEGGTGAGVIVTLGVVTYGASAKLQYNKATTFTATTEEWISPFVATGGVSIIGGNITNTSAFQIGNNTSVPLNIGTGATLTSNNTITLHGDFTNTGTLTSSGNVIIDGTVSSQSIAGFTTAGNISMTKASGTATFAGNVNGGGLTINGAVGTLDLGTALTHVFTGTWTRTAGTLRGGTSTLRIGGSVSGTGGTFTADLGTVDWNAAGPQTIAAVTYYNLSLSGSGTKTFGNTTINISLNLSIAGAGTVVANLGTGVTHQAKSLTLNGVAQATGTWGSTGSTAANKTNTYFLTASNGILNVSCLGLWTGATSTDWNTTTNWCSNVIPTAAINVLIPSGGNQPVIGAAGGLSKDITITSGATLAILASNSLTVSGNWTNYGTFTSNTSTVTFNAATPSIIGSSTNFYNISNASTTMTFNASSTTISGSAAITFTNVTLNTRAGGNVTFNPAVLINGSLTFSAAGILVVGSSSNVTIGTAGTITGAASDRYIQLDGSTGTGSNLIVTTSGATGVGVAGSWANTYPIGTAIGGYTQVQIGGITNAPSNLATLSIKAIYYNSSQGQLRRVFRMTVGNNSTNNTNFSGTTTFNYNYVATATPPTSTDLSSGDALSNYNTIWYLASSTTTPAWTSTSGTNGGVGNFTVNAIANNLINGTYYYTLGQSSAYPNTWYSYQTGVWSNWQNWTSDPSGSSLVNALNLPPQPGDQIVILNGITITNDVNSQIVSSTTINSGATLDISTTTGNALGPVSGSGLLRINGVSLPTGTYTSFVASTGGTIEYYNTGGTVSATQTTYNNLKFSNSTGSNIIFITATNPTTLTINGNLNINATNTGTVTWQINGNGGAYNVQQVMTIAGDITVSSNGKITAGTGRAGASTTQHSLTLSGNLTNNGTIQFFDPTQAPFTSDPRTIAVWSYNVAAGSNSNASLVGNAVNVTFSGTNNATVTCNGQTDFYRFIVNKGTGQQATVTVNSSSTSNFRFFGPSNLDADISSGNTATYIAQNALTIINGTLQLTGSIDIPVLQVNYNTSGNGYTPIPITGALWLNGANVTVQLSDNSQAAAKDGRILVSGLLRVTDGTINNGFGKGIGSQNGGTYRQEGGTVNCWQFRPKATGTGGFSYIQTGGTLNVGYGFELSGGLIDGFETIFCRFDLNSVNSVFQMSGNAILNVAKPTQNTGAPGGGLFHVGSSTANYSVTGGTVNLYMGLETSANSWPGFITSTAPLYNVNIYNESATAQTAQLTGSDLVVLNDLTISKGGALAGALTVNAPPSPALSGMTAGTYEYVSATSGGSGTGAKFTVVIGSATTITSVTLNAGSSGYVVGDVFTFAGSLFGGAGSATYKITAANVTGAPTFVTNGALNTTIGRNFSIQNGATFTPGTGTITFNGSGAQTWSYGDSPSATSPVITTLASSPIVVNKSAGTLSLSFPNTTFTTLPSTNVLPSIGTLTLTSGTFNDGGSTVTVTSTLTNNAIHTSTGSGSITYTGTSAIAGNNGTFGNLVVTNNGTVSVSGNQTVTGNLALSSSSYAGTSTILNIGQNNLTVNGSITAKGTLGTSYCIQTSGLYNAGGLTRPYVAGTPLTFPIGSNSLYTPNIVTINTATTYGNITVRPVNGEHPNVTTTGVSLKYYWRITSSGFNLTGATINHSCQIGALSLFPNGTNGPTYTAARYDRSANSWGRTTATNTMTTFILPNPFNTGTGWTGVATPTSSTGNPATGDQLDGEYTCGNGAFGTVTTYYSRASTNWNVNSTWSTVAVGGVAAASNPTSCPTCPVVIGDGTINHTVTIPTGIAAATLSKMCGSLTISTGSTLDCGTNATSATALGFGTSTGGAVIGSGTLRVSSGTATGFFPSGDFSTLLGPNGGTVEYYGTGGAGYTIPSTYTTPQGTTPTLNTYYNLKATTANSNLTFPALSYTVYNNFTVDGINSAPPAAPTVRVGLQGSWTINGVNTGTSPALNINTGGYLLLTAATTLVVNDDIQIDGNWRTVNGGGTSTLQTTGSITNNGNVSFVNGTGLCNITFSGSNNATFGGTGLGGTTLNLVTVNKGTSQVPTLTFSLSGTLTTTAVAAGWLTLTNGTFDYEYLGTSLVYPSVGFTIGSLSTTSYTIPATAKLKVGAGTIAITNASGGTNDLFLNGALEVAGGTVYTRTIAANGSDNDIEYAATGTPSITVSGGSLSVDGSIRRSTSTITGALVYGQTGGTVTVGGNNANTTRGVLEIDYNTGSSFSMSGNSNLIIQRPATGTGSYADLYLSPASSSVSASAGVLPTVTIGIAATNNNFELNIAPSLGHLTINSGANATGQNATMYSNDLVLAGNLTINNFASLLTNSLDVSIAGNLAGTGTYNGSANTTTFNGTTNQTALLTSTSSFNNMTISNTGTSGSNTVQLDNTSTAPSLTNLNVLNGIFDVNNLALNVNGNITNNSSQIASAGGSITFTTTTTASHTITSSNGSFTNLKIGGATAATANLVTVSGNMTMNGYLDFVSTTASRYLFIGSNLLTFSSAATISNAGATTFIKTNGVSSDLGVAKNWGASTTSFTYTVGTRTNYTPVLMGTTSGFAVSTPGTLTVIPVDDVHPTANPDGTLILDYYWKVLRDNTFAQSNNSGSLIFQVPTALIGGATGTLSGYLLDAINLIGWSQGGTINAGVASLTFNANLNSGFTSSVTPYPPGVMPAANGEFNYTFGTSTNLLNPVAPIYSRFGSTFPTQTTSVGTSFGGSWSAAGGSNWTTSSTGYGSPYGSVPRGRPVVILSGATINLDAAGQSAYTTQINNGGILAVSTAGNSIGSISGTGTLRTTTSSLPAGTYTTFTAAGGGTIEYASTMTMNSRTTYNNLLISSDYLTFIPSVVTMTASNLIINGDLTVSAGNTLDDSGNGVGQGGLAVAGTFDNSGIYNGGTGTAISVAGNLKNSGTFNASSSTANLTGDLQNTGAFNGGTSTVNLLGNFSNSGTFSAGTGTVNFNGTALQTITGATTFNNLTINNTFATSPQVRVASGNQTVSSTFTNTKGLLDLNSTTLTIGTACASPGAVSHTLASSAGWVYGGSLTRYFPSSAIADGSLTGFFPVGTSVNFRPFSISVPLGDMTGCGTFTLSVGSSTASNVVSIPDPTNTTSPIVVQYQGAWTVASSGVSGGTYNVIAGGNGFGVIGNLANVTLSKATTAVGSYVLVTANSTADPRMERTGLSLAELTTTDGNKFFVGSTNASTSPLPIELLSFSGEAKNFGVDLQWKTVSELNNDYFTVSHSSTGVNFQSIGTVKGNGTTNTPHDYSLVDYKPVVGKNYYQLKQTDFDNHVTTSETIIVNVLSLEPLIAIHPNPIRESQLLNVAINGLEVSTATEIQIVNIQGTTVKGATASTDSDGSLKTSLDLTGLSAGLYILKVQNVHYKFIIE